MLYPIPTPVKGATHADVSEVAINIRHGFCVVRATLGTVVDGAEHLDASLPQWEVPVTVQDATFKALLAAHPDPSELTTRQLITFIGAEGLWQ